MATKCRNCTDLSAELAIQIAARDILRAQLIDTAAEIFHFRTELNIETKACNALRTENYALRAQLRDHNAVCDSALRAQLEELSTATEALRAEYVAMRAERDAVNNVILELQERIE